jgi:hypothetical protein
MGQTDPARIDYLSIPASTVETIDLYSKSGAPPGQFVTAVLSNDLMEAFGRADQGNCRAMRSIVAYVYNKIPSAAWGSPEAVKGRGPRPAVEGRLMADDLSPDGGLAGLRVYPEDETYRALYAPPPREIAKALVSAQKHVSKIAKGKTADVKSKTGASFSYDFVGHGELIDEGRSAALEAGLALSIPTWILVEGRQTIALVCYLVHDSGESWRVYPNPEMPIMEGPGRPLDEAVGAGLSYCQRYIWNQLLQIPRVDRSAEVNQRDDADHVPSKGSSKGKGSSGPALNGTILMGRAKGKPLTAMSSESLTRFAAWLHEKNVRPDHLKEIETELAKRLEAEAKIAQAKEEEPPPPDEPDRDDYEADDPAHP